MKSNSQYLFSGLIECYCGWKHRGKSLRGKKVYICGQYSTKGKDCCSQNRIDEEDLIFLIKSQFYLNNIEWKEDIDYIKKNIKNIKIGQEEDVFINYFKLPQTVWSKKNILHKLND